MIEDNVVIEVGAIVEAKRVGEGCLIEVNAKVGRGAVLGKVYFTHLARSFVAVLIQDSTAK